MLALRERPAVVDPLAELERRGEDLWSLFDAASEPPSWEAVDLQETGDAFILDVELPGVRKRDAMVEVHGRRVVVTGLRKQRERVGRFRRRTRSIELRREVVLPVEVDAHEVTASLRKGRLTVRLPKPAWARRRRIPVH